MSFLHRFLWAWLGSALPPVLLVLASGGPLAEIPVKVAMLALKVGLGCGLLSALTVASLIRHRPVAMLLTAQTLTILFFGWYLRM